jgi:hypothetical protein
VTAIAGQGSGVFPRECYDPAVTPKAQKWSRFGIRRSSRWTSSEMRDGPQNSLPVDRPYYEPGLLLGTSAFTAAGWEGSFYPAGMKARDFLPFYKC